MVANSLINKGVVNPVPLENNDLPQVTYLQPNGQRDHNGDLIQQGLYLSEDLLIDYAAWLSPEFKLSVYAAFKTFHGLDGSPSYADLAQAAAIEAQAKRDAITGDSDVELHLAKVALKLAKLGHKGKKIKLKNKKLKKAQKLVDAKKVVKVRVDGEASNIQLPAYSLTESLQAYGRSDWDVISFNKMLGRMGLQSKNVKVVAKRTRVNRSGYRILKGWYISEDGQAYGRNSHGNSPLWFTSEFAELVEWVDSEYNDLNTIQRSSIK